MTIPLIIYRSLRQHALSTLVTALSIALACGLLMTVWMVKSQSQRAFETNSTAWDAVLGARGAKLQLVLNSIFHIEAPTGSLTPADCEKIKKNPGVKTATPISGGHSYKGWRVVGTIPEMFSQTGYAPRKKYAFKSGRLFKAGAREAIAGSFAAEQLDLRPGATFRPISGLADEDGQPREDEYIVTGILAPTNTPADRVLWTSLRPADDGGPSAPGMEISAVLLQLTSPAAGRELDREYNIPGGRLTFAYPASKIIREFFHRLSWFEEMLALIAAVVVLVAAGSVLASIYASMSARQHDIAILRSLGAKRSTVFGTVVLEAVVIGALGAIGGFAVYFALMSGVAEMIREQTGVVIAVTAWHPVLVLCPLCMIGLGALAGLVPASKAYRVPVAQTLSPLS